MIRVELTETDIEDIAEALDNPDTTDAQKLKLLAIRMHHEGAKQNFIVKCLNLHRNTVSNYLKEFQDGAIAATLEDRFYRPSSSLEPFMNCIKCSFLAVPVVDAAQAVMRIESLTGIRLSQSQARRTMKKLGMKVRKATSIPAKADSQLQFEFYTNEMVPRLAEAEKGERKVYFVDAAHFVLGAFLGMIWCFARVFIKTSPGLQRYNVLGAVDSHSHEFVSIRTTENVNAATVVSLIEKIRKKHPDQKVTLIMDNARYQRCKLVTEYAEKSEVELLFLPPYSPNLNLIERMWKLTKRRCLTNRYHRDFKSFCHAIDQCLDDMQGSLSGELASLLTLNFQFFNLHKS